MISVLEGLDKVTAAGMLARTALSLAYSAAPAATVLAGEEQVRASIIQEARDHLGLKPDDFDPQAIEKITDFLDTESDKLISPPDVASAFSRLAERGDLPSDLYKVQIAPDIKDLHGKGFALEKKLIETTIRNPTVEQHYGKMSRPGEPVMVSLFAKSFRTRWTLKDFVMLVGAVRNGTTLSVTQAWRIYTSRVDVNGAKEPVDWLRRFAETYGADIEINGRKAKFFEIEQIDKPLQRLIEVGGKGKPRQIIISDFTRWENDKEVASLVTAIDSDKYRATLKALGVRQQDILETLQA
jgi:hypothetical protein